MKKTIISILICSCLLVGCNMPIGTANQIEVKDEQVKYIKGNLQNTYFDIIPNTYLVYDKNTKIIYYINKTGAISERTYFAPSPYYSKNGKLCRYNEQEQKIEELKQYE